MEIPRCFNRAMTRNSDSISTEDREAVGSSRMRMRDSYERAFAISVSPGVYIHIDSDAGEELSCILFDFAVVDKEPVFLRLTGKKNILGDRHGRDETEFLKNHADPGLPGVKRVLQGYFLSIDSNDTAVFLINAVNDLHQGGLACTILSDERMDLA